MVARRSNFVDGIHESWPGPELNNIQNSSLGKDSWRVFQVIQSRQEANPKFTELPNMKI